MDDKPMDRDGMGRCKECIYHDMEGYNHYCTKPYNINKSKEKSWINETYSRGWHNCCVVFKDGD